MVSDTNQTEFWSHFQTEHVDVFAGSQTRLDFLVRLAGRLSTGGTLLNIGCGNGYLERCAQQKKWTVISVDPDSKSADRLKGLGFDGRRGTVESLPVASASIDTVICTEVFEHLSPASMESGLTEIRRVLKLGGLLIGTVPYRENLSRNEVLCPDCKKKFHRWGHQQSFDETSMRSVLSKYLAVRKVQAMYYGTWNVSRWPGKLSIAARLAFSWVGIHGDNSNLLFVASRN